MPTYDDVLDIPDFEDLAQAIDLEYWAETHEYVDSNMEL